MALGNSDGNGVALPPRSLYGWGGSAWVPLTVTAGGISGDPQIAVDIAALLLIHQGWDADTDPVATVITVGTAEIGKVNWRHINVLGTTLTREANATPYSINDSISDNATAGSVTALTSNDLSDVNDDPINLSEVLLDSSDTGPGTASAIIRCHLFNSNPISSSGVVAGDNVAYSNKKAGWFGSFSGIMRLFSDGSKGRLLPDEGSSNIAFPASGAKNIWYQLQTLTAFTPSANSTTFAPRFKGFQGRR